MKEQIEMYVWVTGPPRFSSYFLISPVTAACAFTEMLSSPKVSFTVMFDVQHLCQVCLHYNQHWEMPTFCHLRISNLLLCDL